MVESRFFCDLRNMSKSLKKKRFYNRDTPKVAFFSILSIFTSRAQREQKPRKTNAPLAQFG